VQVVSNHRSAPEASSTPRVAAHRTVFVLAEIIHDVDRALLEIWKLQNRAASKLS
jgi:hypothetical protein